MADPRLDNPFLTPPAGAGIESTDLTTDPEEGIAGESARLQDVGREMRAEAKNRFARFRSDTPAPDGEGQSPANRFAAFRAQPEDTRPSGYGEALDRGITQAGYRAVASGGGLIQAAGEWLGVDAATSKGEQIGRYSRELYEARERASGLEDESLPYYISHATETLFGNVLPSVAVGVATRNPNLAITMLGGQVFGEKFSQARSEGRSREQASLDAGFYALSEAITEHPAMSVLLRGGSPAIKAVLSKLAGKVPRFGRAVAGKAAHIGEVATLEGLSEVINAAAQRAYDTGVVAEDGTLQDVLRAMVDDEALREYKDSLIIGTMVGGGMATITPRPPEAPPKRTPLFQAEPLRQAPWQPPGRPDAVPPGPTTGPEAPVQYEGGIDYVPPDAEQPAQTDPTEETTPEAPPATEPPVVAPAGAIDQEIPGDNPFQLPEGPEGRADAPAPQEQAALEAEGPAPGGVEQRPPQGKPDPFLTVRIERDRIDHWIAENGEAGFEAPAARLPGRTVTVNPSAKNSGQWQLTVWDERGPSSDMQFSTHADAIRQAVDFGVDLDAASVLRPSDIAPEPEQPQPEPPTTQPGPAQKAVAPIPEETSAPPATPRARWERERTVDPRSDDLLAAVAKLGGWRRDDAGAEGVDEAEFGRRGHKILHVFTKGGRSADDLALALAQHGWPFEMQGRSDKNAFLRAMDEALRGRALKSDRQDIDEDAIAGEFEGRIDPAAYDDAPSAALADPADDIAPGDMLPQTEYADDLDAFGRRVYELSRQAEAIEEGAGEGILESAAMRGWNDDQIVDALEEWIHDRAERTGAEAPAGDEGPAVPSAQEPGFSLAATEGPAAGRAGEEQGDLLGAADPAEPGIQRNLVEQERLRRDREAAERADAGYQGGGPLFARADAEAAGQTDIETAAAQAATSPENDIPAPTEGQIKAGNYRHGHVRLHGFDISIENPAGTRRRPEGPPLAHPYGYFRGTVGKDKDHLDVFLGPQAEIENPRIFVVDQRRPDGTGFDEHKILLGFDSAVDARRGYLANYPKGWKGAGPITEMTLDEFRAWTADPKATKRMASRWTKTTKETPDETGSRGSVAPDPVPGRPIPADDAYPPPVRDDAAATGRGTGVATDPADVAGLPGEGGSGVPDGGTAAAGGPGDRGVRGAGSDAEEGSGAGVDAGRGAAAGAAAGAGDPGARAADARTDGQGDRSRGDRVPAAQPGDRNYRVEQDGKAKSEPTGIERIAKRAARVLTADNQEVSGFWHEDSETSGWSVSVDSASVEVTERKPAANRRGARVAYAETVHKFSREEFMAALPPKARKVIEDAEAAEAKSDPAPKVAAPGTSQDANYYYVAGESGMKSDGSFTKEKRHWMPFGYADAARMDAENKKPYGATRQGVFIGTVSGKALRQPPTPGASIQTNPFRAKAEQARERYQMLIQPSSRDAAMADAFPLGVGVSGNRSSRRTSKQAGKRIDASIDRAVEAEEARKQAEHYEALTAAYDRGEVDAQGRRTKSEAKRSKEADAAQMYSEYLRARVKPGDSVTLVQNPDGGGHVVRRVSKKSVTLESGGKWESLDIRPWRDGRPMTEAEARADFEAWREESKEGASPRFSQPINLRAGAAPTSGMTVARAEAIIAPVLERWPNRPQVRVVQSGRDLPASIRAAAPGTPEGVWDGGTVRLVADMLPTRADVERVLAHEAVGHAGLEQILGDDYLPIMRTIALLRRSKDPQAKALFAKLRERYKGLYAKDGRVLDLDGEAREFMAVLAEQRPSEGALGKLWRRIQEAVTRFLRALGLRYNPTMADLQVLLSMAEARLREAPQGRLATDVARFSASDQQLPPFEVSALRSITAGDTMQGGMTVGEDIANTGSIAATLGDDYETIGLREIPMDEWGVSSATDVFYEVSDVRRAQELAEELRASQRVDPLIVVVQPNGEPYILEGNHRLAALAEMNAEAFPALVVRDTSEDAETGHRFSLPAQADAAPRRVEPQAVMRGRRGQVNKARFDADTALAWLDAPQQSVVTGLIATGKAVRGADVLGWLREYAGKPVHVVAATPTAQPFYRKMQDRGVIAGWTEQGVGEYMAGTGPARFSMPPNQPPRYEGGIDAPELLGGTTASTPSAPAPSPQQPIAPSDFAAENRRIREQDRPLWNKAKALLRRNFAPGGLLPADVFDAKVARDSQFEVVEFEIKHKLGVFENAVKEAYGKRFKKLDDKTQQILRDGLAGQMDVSLPETVKVPLLAMRQYIDKLSQEYVTILEAQANALRAEGKDGEAKADLIDTIRGNMGEYVHRSYRVFDDPKWFKSVPDDVLDNARSYLVSGYMKQGDSQAEAQTRAAVKLRELLKHGTAYESMEGFIRESKLGAKDLSVLKHRKQIAPEIRALFGEYVDPRLNFAKSATKMGRLIWNQRFLERVRKAGMGVFLFEGEGRNPDATTKIAGDASAAYSPLNGLWTFPEIDQAFRDALDKEQMETWYRTIVQLNGMVKVGKAQPLDAVVYTPTGPARMGDLAVGDEVCGIAGRTKILGIYPQGVMPVYRITFSDGATTEATGEHLWEVIGQEKRYTGVFTTEEIMGFNARAMGKAQIAIPVGRADFDAAPTSVDPYLLGALLGDGSTLRTTLRFSTGDQEMLDSIRAVLPPGHKIERPPSWAPCDYTITTSGRSEARKNGNGVTNALRLLGAWGHLSAQKSIPDIYKYNSAEVRLAVVQGLLDTDGWVLAHDGQPEFSTGSKRLADDFIEVAESLGATALLRHKITVSGKDGYEVRLRVENAPDWFRLSRKKSKARAKKKPVKRTFKSIELVGEKECQCIMVDDPRHLYLTDRFIATHNTVLSPTTAMRNWMSAFFFTMANGHFDLRHAEKSLAGLREYFTQQGKGARLDYLRKLKELGVVYDTPYAGEMMRLLDDSRIADDLLSRDASLVFKDAFGYAQKFYQFGDDFWKIIGFENEKRLLMKHAKMDEAAAEQMAAERVRNTYPTYSMVGKAIKSLRRFPLAGTFVSFPAEIVRTSINMVRYAAQDMQTPGMRPIAMRRIAGLAMVAGFAYALQELSKVWLDVDDDEEEAVRRLAAPWAKNSNIWFLDRKPSGELRYLDLSFLDPYNYWKRPITAVIRNQPWEDKAIQSAKEVFEPFLGTDIAFGTLMEVYKNKKESGGRVYNERDLPHRQLADQATHILSSLQPGLTANIVRTVRAVNEEVTRSGRKYDLGDEMAAWVGFRVTTLDPKVSLYYRVYDFQDGKRGADSALSQTLRDPNAVSGDDIDAAFSRSMKIRRKAYEDMFLVIEAARKSGLSGFAISRVLSNSGVSAKDRTHLLRGRMPRWRPSRSSMVQADKKARALFGEEARREIHRRYIDLRRRAHGVSNEDLVLSR